MATSRTILPVILAGGAGTRLWPVSRPALPKQFSPVFAGGTLFERTLARITGAPFAPPLVVTGAEHRDLAAAGLARAGVEKARLVLEPRGRGTAAAVALAVQLANREMPETLVLVLPSDHLIRDADSFRRAIITGAGPAAAGAVVTFGVRPSRPETGFGYIELAGPPGEGPQPFLQFVEKPDRQAAAAMVASGRHLWNAGIFLFRADVMLRALAAHAPAVLESCRRALHAGSEEQRILHPDPATWDEVPAISLDHAVMERLDTGVVVPLDCGWNDLGSWQTVWQESVRDDAGVAARGAARAIECRDSLLIAEEGIELVGLGLEGMAVVAAGGAVLVVPLARAAEVGEAAAETESAVEELPWGRAQALISRPGLALRRLLVEPGNSLRLSPGAMAGQWVVLSGRAGFPGGDRLDPYQSFSLGPGEQRELASAGTETLELIELLFSARSGTG